MRMARPLPSPNICMKLIFAVPKAKKLTASRQAAAVTMRPVWPRPSVTAVRVSAPWSCSSLIRLVTNTS